MDTTRNDVTCVHDVPSGCSVYPVVHAHCRCRLTPSRHRCAQPPLFDEQAFVTPEAQNLSVNVTVAHKPMLARHQVVISTAIDGDALSLTSTHRRGVCFCRASAARPEPGFSSSLEGYCRRSSPAEMTSKRCESACTTIDVRNIHIIFLLN